MFRSKLVCLLALLQLGCDSGPEQTARPALTRAELLDPDTCKACHPRHYVEWPASMHAYASTDPVFLAMNRRGQEETGGQLGEFCVQCHMPMAVRERQITDLTQLEQVPAVTVRVVGDVPHYAAQFRDQTVLGRIEQGTWRASAQN